MKKEGKLGGKMSTQNLLDQEEGPKANEAITKSYPSLSYPPLILKPPKTTTGLETRKGGIEGASTHMLNAVPPQHVACGFR